MRTIWPRFLGCWILVYSRTCCAHTEEVPDPTLGTEDAQESPTNTTTLAPTVTSLMPITSTPDPFRVKLGRLLTERRFTLPNAAHGSGQSRFRRSAEEKPAQIWALLQGPYDQRPSASNGLPVRSECKETVYKGTKWPATPPDKCAEMDCPGGNLDVAGVMRWCCNSRGYWKNPSPNTAQCFQRSVLMLKDEITSGNESAGTPRNLPNTIKLVNEFLAKNTLKVGGDLLTIVDLLDKATMRSEDGQLDVGPVSSSNSGLVGEETAIAVDKLLSADVPWNEVPTQTRHSCATTLMRTLDVAGIILIANNDSVETTHEFMNFKMNLLSSKTKNVVNRTVMLPKQNAELSLTQSSAQLGLARDTSSEDVDGKMVIIVFTEFPRLDKLLYDDGNDQDKDPAKQELNSPVISIHIGSESDALQLSTHVAITLPMLTKAAESPTCVFWDTLLNEWSPEGCGVGSRNATHVVCLCEHLSNFGVLMDLNGILDRTGTGTSLRIITLVGCSISIFCLTLCIAVFGFFRSIRNTRSSIHLNLCLSMLLAELVLMLGLDHTQNKKICAVIAGCLHYLFLAVFSWMLLEGFHITFLLVTVFNTWRKRYLRYYIFGYGLPLCIVGITAGIKPQGYGTPQYCWLSRNDGVMWSYAGPIAFIIMINLGVLVFTIRTTCRLSKQPTSGIRLETARRWIRTTVIMLPLLGLTWIPGFLLLDTSKTSILMTYIFCVLNTLQGFCFFVFHCALNRSVRRLVVRKLEATQFFNRCMPIRFRRSSAGDDRGCSSTATSDSRTMFTIFGKTGSLSFDRTDAVQDPMAGKFTSIAAAVYRHPHYF